MQVPIIAKIFILLICINTPTYASIDSDYSWYKLPSNGTFINTRSLRLFDSSRKRTVPIIIYTKGIDDMAKRPVVIINPGHGVRHTEYSYLATYFVNKGYAVVSIAHQLPTDPNPIPKSTIFETRKPIWKRGAQNILFVINSLKNMNIPLDLSNLTFVGHSGGGDIVICFIKAYPKIANHVILLDSLRAPIPRAMEPKMLYLKAPTSNPDPGVLPNSIEQEKFYIKIVDIENANHIDFCDRGPEKVKLKIKEMISTYSSKKGTST